MYQLRISGLHYDQVKHHLFPGDGKEAIAIALCGRLNFNDVTILLIHKLLLIPHSHCKRDEDYIEWPTEPVVPFLTEAMGKDMAIVKIHSHPGGYDRFSRIDDVSDKEFFDSVYGWTNSEQPHGSMVMLPDGSLFGRMILFDLSFARMDKISVAGDQILSWPRVFSSTVDEAGKRTAQLFGDATYEILRHLRVGLIGCSGTGSVVFEQLLRFQVGVIVPVDPDWVDGKNLNRIINSKRAHAKAKLLKVFLAKQVADETDLGTIVIPFDQNVYNSPEAVRQLALCDIIVGCSDTAEARDLANRLNGFYLVPYLDMGIAIDSDGNGGISKIEGSVHYLQPGKSSLLTRGVYSVDDLAAESLHRKNPSEYERLIQEGRKTGHKYINDVSVERPAVISLNMQIASIAINELLNRVHPYKISQLYETAKIAIDITDNFLVPEKETDFEVDQFLLKRVGRGDVEPMLEIIDLAKL